MNIVFVLQHIFHVFVYIFHFVSVIFRSGTEIATLHMTCAIEVYFDLFLELVEPSQIFLFS